jgi:hypothetical protein
MNHMPEIDPLVIPIVAILMPLLLVPIVLVLKFRHSRREWEHKERMKAMETGLPIPPSATMGGVAAVGAGVPIASVLSAAVASLLLPTTPSHDHEAIHGIIWFGAVLISALAFGSSLVLAHMHSRALHASTNSQRLAGTKPAFDPDSYDVVSSRG